MNGAQTDSGPTLAQATQVFARIGLLSFGGPAAQISLMHNEIVEKRGWLSERQFLDTTSFCMLLPGPEAMQIATYTGWRLHGTLGGIIAGSLFVLPGALVTLALGMLYVSFGQLPLVRAAFLGVQAAVIAIVLKALLGIAGRALQGWWQWALAVFGFVALFVFGWPFPLVITLAAVVGAVMSRGGDLRAPSAPVRPSHLPRTVAVWGTLWAGPLLALWLTAPEGLLLQVGLFFSKLAIVTFGGAYAVLAYMVQEVVTDYGWLSGAQMLDGLGLAETTPGPLILVTQFVGYLAGAQAGGWGLGLAAALVTLWVTFIPCFLWIFAAAPYVERLLAQPRLSGALRGITAAVVGVIANLSVWFALQVFFAQMVQVTAGPLTVWVPNLNTVQPFAVGIAVLSALALFRLQWSLGAVLGAAAGLALFAGVMIGPF